MIARNRLKRIPAQGGKMDEMASKTSFSSSESVSPWTMKSFKATCREAGKFSLAEWE